MGNLVMDIIPHMANYLAGNARSTAGEAQVVYFDVFGLGMVTYTLRVGQVLHVLPLVVVLAVPFVLCKLQSNGGKGQGRWV